MQNDSLNLPDFLDGFEEGSIEEQRRMVTKNTLPIMIERFKLSGEHLPPICKPEGEWNPSIVPGTGFFIGREWIWFVEWVEADSPFRNMESNKSAWRLPYDYKTALDIRVLCKLLQGRHPLE